MEEPKSSKEMESVPQATKCEEGEDKSEDDDSNEDKDEHAEIQGYTT